MSSRKALANLSEAQQEMLTDSHVGTIVLTSEERALTTASLFERKDELVKLIQEKNRLLSRLKPIEDRIQELCDVVLPKLMESLGEASVPIGEDSYLNVEEKIFCGISKANESEAFQWLIDNGHSSVIAELLELRFDKGMKKEREEAEEALKKANLQYVKKSSVHPQTLKALLKRLIGKGIDVPFETFSIFTTKRCEIREKN